MQLCKKNPISMQVVADGMHFSDQSVGQMAKNGLICGSQFLPYSVWMAITI